MTKWGEPSAIRRWAAMSLGCYVIGHSLVGDVIASEHIEHSGVDLIKSEFSQY